MANRKIIVVGGGVSGLMAAISAAQNGEKVQVFEQLDSVGRKLLATGNGRCNVTNILDIKDFAMKFGKNWRFMLSALYDFHSPQILEYFAKQNVPLELVDKFHYFPQSKKASDVLQALKSHAERLNVETFCHHCIDKLIVKDNKIQGVTCNSKTYLCDAVILACGGKSYPELGGKGIGYTLAKDVGHNIIEPLPAMVGLKTKEDWVKKCVGLSLYRVEISVQLSEKKPTKCQGELLFTHSGISAFSVINISGDIVRLQNILGEVPIKINFFADKNVQFWEEKFAFWHKNHGNKKLNNLLSEFMPKRLIENLMPEAEIIACNLTKDLRNKIIEKLTACDVTIIGNDGWNKAQVTTGGVDIKEINSSSLESKLVKGLYFAGELMDIDGPCGGYNITWALSSGRLAGLSKG